MKRTTALVAFATSLLLTFTVSVRAVPITIGFDDLPDGTHVDNQYAGLGVVFTTHWLDPSSHTDQFGNTYPAAPIAHPSYAAFSGLNGVGFDSYCNASEYVQANFNVPVGFVSIEIQPFEGGTYQYGLELYNALNQLIGQSLLSGVTVHSSWSAIDPSELVTLAVQTPSADVAYARFYGYTGGGINGVDFDNFRFGTASVPDGGSTMLLLGSVLMGLEGLRRRLRQ